MPLRDYHHVTINEIHDTRGSQLHRSPNFRMSQVCQQRHFEAVPAGSLGRHRIALIDGLTVAFARPTYDSRLGPHLSIKVFMRSKTNEDTFSRFPAVLSVGKNGGRFRKVLCT